MTTKNKESGAITSLLIGVAGILASYIVTSIIKKQLARHGITSMEDAKVAMTDAGLTPRQIKASANSWTAGLVNSAATKASEIASKIASKKDKADYPKQEL